MADIILKACAFDPKDRFATASEMKKALQKLIKPDESREAPSAERKPKKTRKAPLIAGLAAAFLCVMIIGYSLGYARNAAGDARSNIAAVPKSDVTPLMSQDTSDTEQERTPPISANANVTIAPETVTSPPTVGTLPLTAESAVKPSESSLNLSRNMQSKNPLNKIYDD